MRRRGAGVLAAILLVLTACTACGIADDRQPRAIDKSEVPFDLLSPTSSTNELPPGAPAEEAILYLVDEEERVVRPVVREVPRPVNISQVLRELIDARAVPPQKGDPPHLSNLISRRIKLIEVRTAPTLDGGQHVTINLDQFFPGLSSDDVSLAVAQVVFTVTEHLRSENVVKDGHPVTVEFQIRGQKKDIRTSEGETKGEVTEDDFAPFDKTRETESGVSSTTTATYGQAPERTVTTES